MNETRLRVWSDLLKVVLQEAKRDPLEAPPSVTDLGDYYTQDDREENKGLQAKYRDLRARFLRQLATGVSDLDKGDIEVSELNKAGRGNFSWFYAQAYKLGKGTTGDDDTLSDEDKAYLKDEIKDEYRYFKKFSDDIAKGEGKMNYQDRAEMYGQALDGLFLQGQVSSLPHETQIYWRLGVAEHCNDCLEFAAGSPYTPDTLPAVPRDGTSACLTNCKCFLDFEVSTEKGVEGEEEEGPRYPHPDEIDSLEFPDKQPSDDLASQMNSVADDLNYYRQRLELSTDEEEQKEWAKKRREANLELIRLQRDSGVTASPKYSLDDLLTPLKDLPEGMTPVEKIASITNGQRVSLVKGRSVYRGDVVSRDEEGVVKVKTDDGHEVEINLREPPYILFPLETEKWDSLEDVPIENMIMKSLRILRG